MSLQKRSGWSVQEVVRGGRPVKGESSLGARQVFSSQKNEPTSCGQLSVRSQTSLRPPLIIGPKYKSKFGKAEIYSKEPYTEPLST